MGDGEQDEGQVWEAAMTAAHYKIDSLCAIIDYNKQQIDGWLSDVKNIEPLKDKWSAFGWNVIEADGHDFKQLMDALDKAEMIKGKPTVIIAHTVKGKGVSFIEKNSVGFHGTAPKKDDLEKALKEIEEGK
jgi:transketolase